MKRKKPETRKLIDTTTIEEFREKIYYEMTTEGVLRVLNDRYDQMGNNEVNYDQVKFALIRAIRLANSPDDAFSVFENRFIVGKKEEGIAFNRMLTLCKTRADIIRITNRLYASRRVGIKRNECSNKLLEREQQLPDCLPENSDLEMFTHVARLQRDF